MSFCLQTFCVFAVGPLARRCVVLDDLAGVLCDQVLATRSIDIGKAVKHRLDLGETWMWTFCWSAARDWILSFLCDGSLHARAEAVVTVAVFATWHVHQILGPERIAADEADHVILGRLSHNGCVLMYAGEGM